MGSKNSKVDSVHESPKGVVNNRKKWDSHLKLLKELTAEKCQDINKYTTKEGFNKLLQENWMLYSVQEKIACVVKKELSSLPFTEEGIKVGNKSLQKIFYPIKQLSTKDDAVYGITALTSFKGSVPFAIIKYATKNESLESELLIHDLTVGMIMNNLRKEVPNFMYTYGGLYCTSPEKNDNFDSTSLCKNDNITTLFIAEYIEGISLYKLLDNRILRIQDIENILIQIIFALCISREKYNFSHNDLHLNNILIKTIKQPIQMNYNIRGKKISITVKKYIPMIIDYGLSEITHNKIKYENNFFDKNLYSINNEDINKIMMFISRIVQPFSNNFNKSLLEYDLTIKKLQLYQELSKIDFLFLLTDLIIKNKAYN
jgi:hypothetical protein